MPKWVDAAELPIMDGSAAPFVFLIQSAGIVAQNAPKKFLVMREPVRVGDESAYAELQPYDGFALKYTLDYDHPVFALHDHTAEVDFVLPPSSKKSVVLEPLVFLQITKNSKISGARR